MKIVLFLAVFLSGGVVWGDDTTGGVSKTVADPNNCGCRNDVVTIDVKNGQELKDQPKKEGGSAYEGNA